MSCFSDSIIMYDFGADEIAEKDARIAELERQVADLKSERLRNPGSYYVVPRETMEAKDARIAELERKLSEASRCDHTAESLRIGQYQHEIAALKEENAGLKARLADAKAQNAKEKRLACEEGKYDKCGVGGIDIDAAIKAARLAQSSLNMKYKLSYAAACLLVLYREYESLKASLSEENKRNGAVAKKEMIDRITNGVYKKIRVDETGIYAEL
jgi:hypothetical protein